MLLYRYMDTTNIITLVNEAGEEVKCAIVLIFELEERNYIALLPLENNEENGDIQLYRYIEDENGQSGLGPIESDEEFNMVAEEFQFLLEDMYDEE